MCHLITMILKPKQNAEIFKEILERHGRNVSDAFDERYKKALGKDELYWYVTNNMCDCGTAIGSVGEGNFTGRLSLKEIRKLEKKGWSQAKIRRRIEEQEKYSKRQVRVENATKGISGNQETDPDGWVSILKEILSCPNTFRVGLVKHWYSESLKTEVLEKHNRVVTEFNEEIGTKLLNIEEDTCYEIDGANGQF